MHHPLTHRPAPKRHALAAAPHAGARLTLMASLSALMAFGALTEAAPNPPDGRGEPTIILNGEPVYFDDDEADRLDEADAADIAPDTPPPPIDDTAYAPGPAPSLARAAERGPQDLDQQPLSTLDLHLEAVVALIEQDRITDAEHLEELINSASTGINNVDLDSDGFVDFVAVREVREHDTILFELIAMPSSDPDAEGLTIASISFRELAGGGGDVEIVAAYSEYVEGYEETAFASVVQHPIYTDSYEPRGFIDWVYMLYRPIYIFSPIYAFTPVWSPCQGATLARRRAAFRQRCGLPRVPTCSPPPQWRYTGPRRPSRRVHRVPPKFTAPKVRRAPRSYHYKPPSPRLQDSDTLSFIPARAVVAPQDSPRGIATARFNNVNARERMARSTSRVAPQGSRRPALSRNARPGQTTVQRPPARPIGPQAVPPSNALRRPRFTRPGFNPATIRRARRAQTLARRRASRDALARPPRTPVRATARTSPSLPAARRAPTMGRRAPAIAPRRTPGVVSKPRHPSSSRGPAAKPARPPARRPAARRPTSRSAPRAAARPRPANRRARPSTTTGRSTKPRSSAAARPSRGPAPKAATRRGADARRPRARTKSAPRRAPASIQNRAPRRRPSVKGFSPRSKR